MAKADTVVNQEPKTTTPQTKRAKKLGEVTKQRADLPEYIKAQELQLIRPFTIFGASPSKGRFGDRINFDIAYKDGQTVIKKVLTLSANDERNDLMYEVRRSSGITNCRLVQIHLGGGQTYWKLIDNDEAVPEDIHVDERQVNDNDIPFA